MMLADMGADVVRVDRPTTADGPGILGRGRRSIAIDLKTDTGARCCLDLVAGPTGSSRPSDRAWPNGWGLDRNAATR